MSICKNCNNEVKEGEKFCGNCGAAIENKIFCPLCGEEAAGDNAFCIKCGTKLSTEEPVKQEPSEPVINNTTKKLTKKPLIFSAVAVVLVAVIVLVSTNLFGGKSKSIYPETLLYIKDKELNYTSLKKINPVQVTSKLAGEASSNIDNRLGNKYFFTFGTYLSEDGNRIFYPDKMSEKSISIYYKDLKSSEDGVKIDSDIEYYSVNKKADKVFYTKGTDRELYINYLSDKEKIDKFVNNFYINDDGSVLVYCTENSDIYIKNGSDDKEKIDNNSNIISSSLDNNRFYYLKDKKIYVYEEGKEKREVASDVIEIIQTCENGEIYFTKPSNISDIMNTKTDDIAAPLYYFDGGEAKLVTEEFYRYYGSISIPQKTCMLIRNGNEKVASVVYKSNVYEIKNTNGKNYAINNETNKLCFLDEYDDKKGYGKLCEAEITDKGLGEIRKVDEDVNKFVLYEYGQCVYFKDAVDKKGDLYVNQKRIDSDVYMTDNSIVFMDDTDTFLYFTDYNNKTSCGTLKICSGNKAEKIADDVHDYYAVNKKCIVYLSDFTGGKGTAYLYSGSKDREKIDEDVTLLVPIFTFLKSRYFPF